MCVFIKFTICEEKTSKMSNYRIEQQNRARE